ncbi:MAG: hypothetical protein U5K74_13405 [Gemmatimonadaceae bacterium]|nr:hypothetical protein [Gemmatimonadaceae bacterium]
MPPLVATVGPRVVVFAGAAFGTFVAFIAAFLVYGTVAEIQATDLWRLEFAVVLAKLVAAMTLGHGLALLLLAFARRAFSTPPMVRSAYAAVTTASLLEAAYLSDSELSGSVSRGLAQLICSLIVSLAICAVRMRRRDEASMPAVAESF